jgi:hypothetical protein
MVAGEDKRAFGRLPIELIGKHLCWRTASEGRPYKG